MSRYEGPAAYGRFELALTVLTIAALAARLGLDGVLVKWMASSKVKGEEEVQRQPCGTGDARDRTACRASAGGFDVGVLPIAHILARGRDAGPDLALGCRRCSDSHRVGRRPLRRFWVVADEEPCFAQPGIVAAGAVTCMVGLGWGIVPSYATSLVASALLGAVLLSMALPKRTKTPTPLSSEWGWRPMLRTGWPMLLGSAMFLVMSWTDTLLLGHYLEEDQVGIYRVAFRMAAVVTLVQAAVNSYAAPLFAERHAAGDRAGLKSALRQTTLLNMAFSVPAFVALVAVPAWWMGWFGDAFAVGATCLVWLAVGQVVNALCGPVMYLLNMTGHERQAQRLYGLRRSELAMNVWAIPRFGIEGAVATAQHGPAERGCRGGREALLGCRLGCHQRGQNSTNMSQHNQTRGSGSTLSSARPNAARRPCMHGSMHTLKSSLVR